MRASGASDKTIEDQLMKIKLNEARIINRADPLIKPIFENLFTSLDALRPSSQQEMDPLIQKQLDTTVNNTTALETNTTAVKDLVTIFRNSIINNRLRVTFN